MVGKIFKVVLTRLAQRRRRDIFEFESILNGRSYAQKIQRAIDNTAKKLEQIPESNPLYLHHESKYEIRYAKALDNKVIFTIQKNTDEVVILTIRNDAEDPAKIMEEL